MRKKDHPLYSTWKNMKARCYVKSNSSYKYYGAKGITVAERWHDFWSFVYDIDNHMPDGHLLYDSDYQLDKDRKGGKIYSLKNCCVISSDENKKMANEKLKRKIIAFNNDGEEIQFDSITEASDALGIKRGYIQSTLRSKYSFKYCD
ncbi:hypothetical protein ASG65_20770 [Bacillus sp. Leaf13]|nr:hypothetical protein ASG65_20770 [Bacillus sp. Leaf13]